jgi:hypothetical protein
MARHGNGKQSLGAGQRFPGAGQCGVVELQTVERLCICWLFVPILADAEGAAQSLQKTLTPGGRRIEYGLEGQRQVGQSGPSLRLQLRVFFIPSRSGAVPGIVLAELSLRCGSWDRAVNRFPEIRWIIVPFAGATYPICRFVCNSCKTSTILLRSREYRTEKDVFLARAEGPRRYVAPGE